MDAPSLNRISSTATFPLDMPTHSVGEGWSLATVVEEREGKEEYGVWSMEYGVSFESKSDSHSDRMK